MQHVNVVQWSVSRRAFHKMLYRFDQQHRLLLAVLYQLDLGVMICHLPVEVYCNAANHSTFLVKNESFMGWAADTSITGREAVNPYMVTINKAPFCVMLTTFTSRKHIYIILTTFNPSFIQ